MKTKARLRGMLLASLAASLWSISGISGEILFKEFHFSADWLVSVRTAVSGILLLIAVVFIEKKSIFKPFKRVEDIIGILLFGIAGIYFVQFTYFRTIELSNVSFATILQFTAPFFIFIYESVKNKKGASCALFVFDTSSETRRRTNRQSSSPSCKSLSCKVSCKADSWAVSAKSRCRRLVVLTPSARSFSARLTRLPRPCESCL